MTLVYSCSPEVVSRLATASWSATSACSEMRSRPLICVSFSLTQLSFTTSLAAPGLFQLAQHVPEHVAHACEGLGAALELLGVRRRRSASRLRGRAEARPRTGGGMGPG